MNKYHSEVFWAGGVRTRDISGEFDESELQYSPELFTECMAQWVAVDDQVT
jgi:hypothetical protein